MPGSGPPGPSAPGPLRVLLVLESAGGGAGRHVLDLAEGLVRRGHDVHLAWSPARAEPAFLRRLDALPAVTRHVVVMARAPGPGDVASLRTLRRLVRSLRPDVVHGHSSKAGALARVACLGLGIPALYTPHAFITLDPGLGAAGRFVYGTAERVLSWLGPRIICVSAEERAHAVGLGISRARIGVVPNGLPPLPPADRAAARHALKLDDDDVAIGFVGRLVSQKDPARLVHAWARAFPSLTAARLVLVGDGPEGPAVHALVDGLGIRDQVSFVASGDGPALMAGFDAFVLPSRYEGFPYVLLEACARGLPIVTTDVGGAAAAVEPGLNGFIVPQDGDVVGALAGRLREVAADAGLRARMGRASADRATRLTADDMVEQTLGTYREVLGGQ